MQTQFIVLTMVVSLWLCPCLAATAVATEQSAQRANPVIPHGFPDATPLKDVGRVIVNDYPVRMKVRTISDAGELTESDTEYRLDRNIETPGSAFVIKASRVTLNLNGYRVRYLNSGQHKEAFGVHIPGYNKTDIAIVNGVIEQGHGTCSGSVGGIGCNPVYSYDAKKVVVGGLEVLYHTPETSGIVLHWNSDALIYSNTVVDSGTEITNRHQGVAAIEANRGGKASGQKIHHNLIRGARHIGIRSGIDSDVYGNEVHGESVVTNSFALSAAGGLLHSNKVFGKGVHPIGIWPGNNTKVFGNYVEVQNTVHGTEYGDTGAACLRMTWGNDNVEVYGNTFVLHADENYRGSGVKSWGRAIWVGLPKPEQRAIFHDNFIYARSREGKAKAAAIAVVCNNLSPNLEFRNNIVSSNWGNVLLADNYGHGGGFARFVDNVFEGDSGNPSYRTIRSQYSYTPSTGIFVGNSYVNGASRDSVDLEFDGSGTKEVSFGWHLTVAVADQRTRLPVADASVTVIDAHGTIVFEGKTSSEGTVVADLLEYTLTNAVSGKKGMQKHLLTPHTITVKFGDRKLSKSVRMNSNNRLELEL